jgi:hypothetical protein
MPRMSSVADLYAESLIVHTNITVQACEELQVDYVLTISLIFV